MLKSVEFVEDKNGPKWIDVMKKKVKDDWEESNIGIGGHVETQKTYWCKMGYWTKLNTSGIINKHKARLIVKVINKFLV